MKMTRVRVRMIYRTSWNGYWVNFSTFKTNSRRWEDARFDFLCRMDFTL